MQEPTMKSRKNTQGAEGVFTVVRLRELPDENVPDNLMALSIGFEGGYSVPFSRVAKVRPRMAEINRFSSIHLKSEIIKDGTGDINIWRTA